MEEHSDEIKFATTNITDTFSNLSMAFNVHTLAMNLCSNTKNLKDNAKILRNAFIITWVIYASIGITGALGLVGKTGDF